MLYFRKMTSLPNARDLLENVFMHRQWQLLIRTYNNLVKTTVALWTLVFSPALFCVSAYVLMAIGTGLDLMSLITLLVLFGIAMSENLICFYFAIQVYKISRVIVRKRYLSLDNHFCKQNYNRRFPLAILLKRCWRSFPQMKIYFLDGNFFEDCTCLVIFQFSVEQAVSLILMDKV